MDRIDRRLSLFGIDLPMAGQVSVPKAAGVLGHFDVKPRNISAAVATVPLAVIEPDAGRRFGNGREVWSLLVHLAKGSAMWTGYGPSHIHFPCADQLGSVE